MAKCFPRVEGFIGYFRDENKFIMNRNWFDGGMRITWDLMEFTSDLLQYKASKEKIARTDSERALISMGILSQVKLRFLDAVRAREEAKKFAEIREKARDNLRVAREREDVTERGSSRRVVHIARQRAMCDLLQAEVDLTLAAGEVHAAMANLQAAVGTNYSVGSAHAETRQPDVISSMMAPVSRWTAPVGAAISKPVEMLDRAIGYARTSISY